MRSKRPWDYPKEGHGTLPTSPPETKATVIFKHTARAKYPRKGRRVQSWAVKLRAGTLGAYGISTLSGSGRAQANKWRQVQIFGANKQRACQAPVRTPSITQNPSGRWRLGHDPPSGKRQERN
eukprot:352329-Chlamydomonas_euryale.AAC.5